MQERLCPSNSMKNHIYSNITNFPPPPPPKKTALQKWGACLKWGS